MNLKMKTAALAIVGALGTGFSAVAGAATFVLPTTTNSTAIQTTCKDPTGADRTCLTMDGVPIAFKYDDFWSYSAKILDEIQSQTNLLPTATFGTYDFTTGTGTIIVNLSSVAGGATNDFDLQDPVDLGGGGDPITGWQCEWGNQTQYCRQYDPDPLGAPKDYSADAADVGTTSTVGEMLAALQDLDPDFTIPVFYADYNQTGSVDSLFFSAEVRIVDLNGNTVANWTLDSETNGTWDPTLPTYNFGHITFAGSQAECDAIGLWDPLTGEGCAGVTDSGNTYEADHNKGSGKPDFMAFAETMDLSQYNSDYLFVVTLNVGCNPEGRTSALPNPDPDGIQTQGCNTDGYEEFGIAGGLGPTQVPEPSSLALIGLGLAGLGFAGRRRQRR